MAGRPVFADPSYLEDIRALRARRKTVAQIAAVLGMSERTVYRLLAKAR